jgi:hypothetical protein
MLSPMKAGIVLLFALCANSAGAQIDWNTGFYRVSANGLYRGYSANEVAQDDRMQGKMVVVGGMVKEIRKDFTSTPELIFETENMFASVHARLNGKLGLSFGLAETTPTDVAKISKHDFVIVVCKEVRRIIDSPVGDNCAIYAINPSVKTVREVFSNRIPKPDPTRRVLPVPQP